MITIVNLSRTKSCIPLDRTSVLGNPFWMRNESEREAVIQAYRVWLFNMIEGRDCTHAIALRFGVTVSSTYSRSTCEQVKQVFFQLVEDFKLGKPLVIGCWCKPKDCHLDVVKSAIEYYGNS
jgi:hypothetical protein